MYNCFNHLLSTVLHKQLYFRKEKHHTVLDIFIVSDSTCSELLCFLENIPKKWNSAPFDFYVCFNKKRKIIFQSFFVVLPSIKKHRKLFIEKLIFKFNVYIYKSNIRQCQFSKNYVRNIFYFVSLSHFLCCAYKIQKTFWVLTLYFLFFPLLQINISARLIYEFATNWIDRRISIETDLHQKLQRKHNHPEVMIWSIRKLENWKIILFIFWSEHTNHSKALVRIECQPPAPS